MRLLITFDHAPNTAVPINYGYLVSSWLYHILGKGNREFATWLHERGYDSQGKQFKLFTFGPLQPRQYRVEGNFFHLVEGPTRLVVSFMANEMAPNLIMGLFQESTLLLGQAVLSMREARLLPAPALTDEAVFELKTPLCLSKNEIDKTYAHYMHPNEPDYAERLMRNLILKQRAWEGQRQPEPVEVDFPYQFELLSEPRSRLQRVRQVQVRGYTFRFKLQAPTHLLRMGYFAGFGEKNAAMGFGFTDLVVESGE